jgi:alkylation response protein AidB-like acyl-CoA dehydrogenase
MMDSDNLIRALMLVAARGAGPDSEPGVRVRLSFKSLGGLRANVTSTVTVNNVRVADSSESCLLLVT